MFRAQPHPRPGTQAGALDPGLCKRGACPQAPAMYKRAHLWALGKAESGARDPCHPPAPWLQVCSAGANSIDMVLTLQGPARCQSSVRGGGLQPRPAKARAAGLRAMGVTPTPYRLLLPGCPLPGLVLAEVSEQGMVRGKKGEADRQATLVLVIRYGRAERLGDKWTWTHTGPGNLCSN